MMKSWQLRDLHKALEEELADTAATAPSFPALLYVKRLIADRVLSAEAQERAEYEARQKAEEETKPW